MIKAVELNKGRTIIYDGELAVVHEAQHVAKGNKRSYVQTKLKNLKSGRIFEERFRVDDRIEIPYVESKTYEFLYKEGDNFIVMDEETYDQIHVSPDVVGEASKWLKPNEKVSCQVYNEQMISFELPFVVELEVTETAPSIKGATATNQLKEAIVETGTKIRVPPFIAIGEVVRIDTRTGEYLERAK